MDHEGLGPEVQHVKESRNGKPYGSKRLGGTVQSQTIATIFQNGTVSDGFHFSFVIGKYKVNRGTTLFSEPFDEIPKSKVTLNDAEFKNLLSLLDESVPVLRSSNKHFITFSKEVEQDQVDQIVQILQLQSTAQKVDMLFKHDLDSEDLLNAIRLRDQAQQLNEFEELLEEDAVESRWQKWFEHNSWVLGSDFVEVLDERRIDVGHIADYLTQAADSHLDLIEIKRPGMSFWNTAKDHDNWVPHPELVAALTQCNNYLYELEREMNSKKASDRLGIPIARPRALLIGGRSKGWEATRFEAQRLLNSSLQNTQVLTYDQVREKAKRMLGIKAV